MYIVEIYKLLPPINTESHIDYSQRDKDSDVRVQAHVTINIYALSLSLNAIHFNSIQFKHLFFIDKISVRYSMYRKSKKW